MNTAQRVIVVTFTRNHPETITTNVRSVRNQSHPTTHVVVQLGETNPVAYLVGYASEGSARALGTVTGVDKVDEGGAWAYLEWFIKNTIDPSDIVCILPEDSWLWASESIALVVKAFETRAGITGPEPWMVFGAGGPDWKDGVPSNMVCYRGGLMKLLVELLPGEELTPHVFESLAERLADRHVARCEDTVMYREGPLAEPLGGHTHFEKIEHLWAKLKPPTERPW